MKKFVQYYGIHHRKITPYHPQANGEIERFMRTINKNIRISYMNDLEWKHELNTFLMNYRSTTHSTI